MKHNIKFEEQKNEKWSLAMDSVWVFKIAPKEVKYLSDSLEVKGVQWYYVYPSGETHPNFIPGGSSPRFKLLPFYIPFLAEKVTLLYI